MRPTKAFVVSSLRWSATVCSCLLIVAIACKRDEPSNSPNDSDGPASDAPADPRSLKTMSVDGTRCDPTGRRVQQLDLNQDSRADMITLSRADDTGDKITCKQADLNFDGQLDAFFHYDDSGAMVREQFDLDFDGRIDMGRFYEAGALTLDEQDLNQDGYTDTWRRYDDGRLLRVESDRDADGRADMFTFYVGSQIDRIGYDVNGDGRVDRWDHDAARRARAALEARARPDETQSTKDSDTAAEFVDEPTAAQAEGEDDSESATSTPAPGSSAAGSGPTDKPARRTPTTNGPDQSDGTSSAAGAPKTRPTKSTAAAPTTQRPAGPKPDASSNVDASRPRGE